MFSKAEKKEFTTLFWTSLGKYMGKHKPLYGKHIKWINYRTGVKDMYVRLKADTKEASISFEIQHKDPEIRKLFFEQLKELKTVFKETAGEWIWEDHHYVNQEDSVARVYLNHSKSVNIYIKDTWADCFKFFELNIVAFDEFWSDYNEIFKSLSD